MKLLFATVAVAYAQESRQVLNGDESEKAAGQGQCGVNTNCYLDGQDNSYYQQGPQGGCYCDAACHEKYNDCCSDMKYQCYNGVEDTLCPSAKCYKQNTQWMHEENTDITCEMNNADCLSNRCNQDSMKVFLDTELFHANSYKEGKFIDLLASGERTLKMNGVALNNSQWTANGDTIVVNVNYANFAVQPTWQDNADGKFIVYTARFSSAGNDDDDSDMIEFFVDHTIDATCKYEADIEVLADGFWVNQEDVVMDIYKESELVDLFDCKFFADSARSNQINSHNIVNMGEMIYATVDSDDVLYGLGYKLSSVVVSDPQNDQNVFDVTANAATVNYSVDPASSQTATGSDIFFEYLSFGFQTYGTPNGNQNELSIKCNVELYIL